jgi:hypothetical protein
LQLLFRILSFLPIGGAETFRGIYFAERQRLAHDELTFSFGILLVVQSLVPESVEHVRASVHGTSQHVQLPEHGLVCDLPLHGLLDYKLCSEQDAAEDTLHILFLMRRRLGAFAD